MNKTIAQLVVELRASLGGLNQEELAERIGVKQPTVSRWEKGSKPDSDQLRALAEIDPINGPEIWLGVAIAKPRGESAPVDNTQRGVVEEKVSGLHFPPGAQTVDSWPKNLKIIGHVKAGVRGFFLDQGEYHGMAFRPPALSTIKDAFAVYVHDDSMDPAFEPGQIAWVHPTRPVAPGNNIIIELTDGQAFIKRLVRRTEKFVFCRQWNPAMETKFDTKKVKRLYYVVGSYRED